MIELCPDAIDKLISVYENLKNEILNLILMLHLVVEEYLKTLLTLSIQQKMNLLA